ncbi:MAG: TolB family protein [Thermoguttaceae bacterium]
MKKRVSLSILVVCVLALLGVWSLRAWARPSVDFAAATAVDRLPSIRPDYCGIVIPPNIAPLNFVVGEAGTDCVVRISGQRGESAEVRARDGRIAIPAGWWRRLLEANRGGEISMVVCVCDGGGKWTRFRPIVNTIAESEIDNYVFYRLIKPIHTVYREVNLYQRDVRSFTESPVVTNRAFGGVCVNCHTPAVNHPDRMLLQTRGAKEGVNYSGTIVVRGGRVARVDTSSLARGDESNRGRIGKAMAGYSAWHPNGQVVAYSANDISQFFHAVGEVRDVLDSESDLAMYHVDSDTVTTCPQISQPERLETFPTWSPDGRFLYFCGADPVPQERYKEIRYDLMRIGYDPETGNWGDLETVLSAKETGMSCTEPRVSPDGRWLLFCMSEYGSFPVYQASSDLWMLDLQTGAHHRLAVNSPRSESWHSWSSNSRWIAFASKRTDGLFARIYISFVDESGQAHKPLVLPQEDPTFYDRLTKTYNVPELAPQPAPLDSRILGRAIRNLGAKSDEDAGRPYP